MALLKAIVLYAVAGFVMGCEQTQVVLQCAEGAPTIDTTPLLADGGTGNATPSGEGGAGGEGGGLGLLADGASCDFPEQCENSYCLPSQNSFGIGYCFSLDAPWCIAVSEPNPFVAQCDGPLKTLFTCGDYNAPIFSTCTVVGIGDIGEEYHCCNKP